MSQNGEDDDEYLKALEIQRRNFEAQFGSIEDLGFQDKSKSKPKTKSHKHNDDESDQEVDSDVDSEMNSSSQEDDNSSEDEEEEEEEEEIVKPKIIKLNSSSAPDSSSSSSTNPLSKLDKKLLKSGRAPTLSEISQRQALANKQTSKQSAAAEDSNEDLENDLKLQRLLKESHILANSLEYSGAELTLQTINFDDPTGKARKRMLTSRMREISSINSTGMPKKLESMPMNMRKGMIKKREERIRKYEDDARNAGIVLSKVRKGELRDLNAGKGSTLSSDRIGTGKKVVKRVRDRGLKIHGIGKSTRNGLVISQNEINRVSNNHGNNRRGRGRR